MDEIPEEDDINMFGVEDDDLEVHYDRKQGLYTPYDDKRDDNENYYQDMENVIIESQREYDLRRKNNQQTPNTKTSDKSSQNSTATKPKVVKQKGKKWLQILIMIKRKALKTMKNGVQTLVVLTLQLVLLLRPFCQM